jgi:hypothetical protein
VPLGQRFSLPTIPNLNDLTHVGSSGVAVVANVLEYTGGALFFADYVKHTTYGKTMLRKWTQTVVVSCGTGGGIAVGIAASGTYSSNNLYAYLNVADQKIYLHSSSQLASNAYAFAVNDHIEITCDYSLFNVKVQLRNLTTGSSLATYIDFNFVPSSVITCPPSVGHFAIANLVGNNKVYSWTCTSACQKNIDMLLRGDSITVGCQSTTAADTYAYQLVAGKTFSYEFMAAVGASIEDHQAVEHEIIEMNPLMDLFMIGLNGSTDPNLQTKYTSHRNNIVVTGIEMIHLATTPRDANSANFNAYKASSFPTDRKVTSYYAVLGGGTNALVSPYSAGDGTHLTDAAQDVISAAIAATIPELA